MLIALPIKHKRNIANNKILFETKIVSSEHVKECRKIIESPETYSSDLLEIELVKDSGGFDSGSGGFIRCIKIETLRLYNEENPGFVEEFQSWCNDARILGGSTIENLLYKKVHHIDIGSMTHEEVVGKVQDVVSTFNYIQRIRFMVGLWLLNQYTYDDIEKRFKAFIETFDAIKFDKLDIKKLDNCNASRFCFRYNYITSLSTPITQKTWVDMWVDANGNNKMKLLSY